MDTNNPGLPSQGKHDATSSGEISNPGTSSLSALMAEPTRKSRQYQSFLQALGKRFNIDLHQAHLMVCEKRKVVYVISTGEIHSLACFHNEKPTPSFRRPSHQRNTETNTTSMMIESEWDCTVIPNRWKAIVFVNDEPWLAETRYENDKKVQYRFSKLKDEGETEPSHMISGWYDTPGAAFKAAYYSSSGPPESGRHNGKLYVGVTYENPQVMLREKCRKDLDAGNYDYNPELKERLISWISLSKTTSNSERVSTTSATSSQRTPKQVNMDNTSTSRPHMPRIDSSLLSWIVETSSHQGKDGLARRMDIQEMLVDRDYTRFFILDQNDPKLKPSDEIIQRSFITPPLLGFSPLDIWAIAWELDKALHMLVSNRSSTVSELRQEESLVYTSLPAVVHVCVALDDLNLDSISSSTEKALKSLHSKYKMSDFIEFVKDVENAVYSMRRDGQPFVPEVPTVVGSQEKREAKIKSFISRAWRDYKLCEIPSGISQEKFVRLVTHLPEANIFESYWREYTKNFFLPMSASTAISYAHRPNQFYHGGRYGEVGIWDSKYNAWHALARHENRVLFVIAAGDDLNTLVSCGDDRIVNVINSSTTEVVYRFKIPSKTDPPTAITALAVSQCATKIFVGTDNSIQVWEKNNKPSDNVSENFYVGSDINALLVNETYLVASSQKAGLFIWNTSSKQTSPMRLFESKGIHALAWHPRKDHLVFGSDDRTVTCLSLDSSTSCVWVLNVDIRVKNVCFSSKCDDMLYISGNENTLEMWDTTVGELVGTMAADGNIMKIITPYSEFRSLHDDDDDDGVLLLDTPSATNPKEISVSARFPSSSRKRFKDTRYDLPSFLPSILAFALELDILFIFSRNDRSLRQFNSSSGKCTRLTLYNLDAPLPVAMAVQKSTSILYMICEDNSLAKWAPNEHAPSPLSKPIFTSPEVIPREMWASYIRPHLEVYPTCRDFAVTMTYLDVYSKEKSLRCMSVSTLPNSTPSVSVKTLVDNAYLFAACLEISFVAVAKAENVGKPGNPIWTIGVWDVSNGHKVHAYSLPTQSSTVSAIAINRRFVCAAIVDVDGKYTIHVWDLQSESSSSAQSSFQRVNHPIYHLRLLASDSPYIACASRAHISVIRSTETRDHFDAMKHATRKDPDRLSYLTTIKMLSDEVNDHIVACTSSRLFRYCLSTSKVTEVQLNPELVERDIAQTLLRLKFESGTQSKQARLMEKQENVKQHLLMFSYSHHDALREVTFLFEKAIARFKGFSVIRDSHLYQLDQRIEFARNSHNIIIPLSYEYARQPFTLIELHHVLKSGANIAIVQLAHKGIASFDFAQVEADIKAESISSYLDDSGWDVLRSCDITVRDVVADLNVLLKLSPAIVLDIGSVDRILNVTVDVIFDMVQVPVTEEDIA